MGFEYFEGKDGQWYFRFRAKNGEIQCSSEGFNSKYNVKRGIKDLSENIILGTVDEGEESIILGTVEMKEVDE